MCLDMTVTHGRKAGLSCAYGMVTADILSAGLMLFGIGLVYTFLLAHALIVKIATGLLFAFLGCMLYAKRNEKQASMDTAGRAGLSLSSFLLSISPATFALLIFLFPALDLTQSGHFFPILTGVAIGSATWCCIILGAGKFIRQWLGGRISRFRTVIGCLFVTIGMGAVISAILKSIS
jgi:threonine/homoserine/homoserine lactone efflux protein